MRISDWSSDVCSSDLFERRQNDLEAEAKKLQDDGQAFQKEADMLASADRAKKEKDLTTRRIDLESKGRQLQEDFNTARQQQFAKTMDAIKTVIAIGRASCRERVWTCV